MPIIKIESSISVPKRRNVGKYPWDDMKIGDSFRFEGRQSTLASTARSPNRNPGRRKLKIYRSDLT